MDSCSKSVYQRFLTHEAGRDNPFASHMGIEIVELSEAGCTGVMTLQPYHFNPNNGVHGGALYTLGDNVAGTMALTWGMDHFGKTVDELSVTTVTGTLNFLRPVKGTKVIGRATPRKMGRTLAVLDVSLTDDQGKETCSGTYTFYYVDRDRFVNR